MNSSYRVVAVVAGKSEAVVLGGLVPDTQYQLTVTAIFGDRKYRSRAIVFRTLGEMEGESLYANVDAADSPIKVYEVVNNNDVVDA